MKISNEKAEESLLTSRAFAPVENETQVILRRALDIMGPDGERWHPGYAPRRDATPESPGCVGWNVRRAITYPDEPLYWSTYDEHPAILALHEAAKDMGEILYSKISQHGPFPRARELIQRAITLASTHP